MHPEGAREGTLSIWVKDFALVDAPVRVAPSGRLSSRCAVGKGKFLCAADHLAENTRPGPAVRCHGLPCAGGVVMHDRLRDQTVVLEGITIVGFKQLLRHEAPARLRGSSPQERGLLGARSRRAGRDTLLRSRAPAHCARPRARRPNRRRRYRVRRHRVGERCLIETDYRHLSTTAANAASGTTSKAGSRSTSSSTSG